MVGESGCARIVCFRAWNRQRAGDDRRATILSSVRLVVIYAILFSVGICLAVIGWLALQGETLGVVFQVGGLLLAVPGAVSACLKYLKEKKRPSPVDPLDWRPDVSADDSVLQLLDWRKRLAPLIGRDDEKKLLLDWARTGRGVKVQFLTGLGGTGKTRLAAEVADELGKDGWNAGFNVKKAAKLLSEAKKRKLLLVIDYPEDDREAARKLLRALARIPESEGPVRALFVSRQDYMRWAGDIGTADAVAICKTQALELRPLEEGRAVDLFEAVQQRVTASLNKPRPQGTLTREQITQWLSRDELFRSPLLVTAAALNYAQSEGGGVGLTAQKVLVELVEREFKRMRRFGKNLGFGEHTVERLVALATVANGLGGEAIERLAETCPTAFTLPNDLIDKLPKLDWADKDEVRPARPDLVAATLVFQVLLEHSKQAPEWLWQALRDAPPGWIAAAERIDHDIGRIYGPTEHRFAQWLAAMVEDQPGRAETFAYVSTDFRTGGCLPLSIAVSRQRLDKLDDEKKAETLNHLSNHLSAAGENADALEAIGKAVEIRQRLATDDPARFEPALAGSLNNLSNCIGEAGENADALEAIRQAVEIYKRLAHANPARFEPALALSLNNLSGRLDNAGENADSLEAIRHSVEIHQRLAEANLARFETDFASSLNNLSADLSDAGENAAALKVGRQAVEIRQRLAQDNPARFEPDLANSLNNLSVDLSEAGENAAALEAGRQAVEIHTRLAQANTARFEPHLAVSLAVLSLRLVEDDLPEALSAIEESVRLFRKHHANAPGFVARYLPSAEAHLADLRKRLDADDAAGPEA